MHESQAAPKPFGLIKGKIGAAKAKIALAKAIPLVIAKAVAKGVKAKAKIAALKAFSIVRILC